MLYAGLDIGTTNCRCLLVDEEGRSVAVASTEVAVEFGPPDRAEVCPEHWWNATCEVIGAALRGAERPAREVAAVGLSGLMHAPVLIGTDARPLGSAQLWMDQRCTPQAAALQARFGSSHRRLDLRGSVSAPKLAWIAAHAPASIDAAQVVLLPKDFVRMRLTGDVATDRSDAIGTGLFDPDKGAWMEDVAQAAGVRADQLPPVRPASAPGGVISAKAAAATGLAEGTPVATGAADTLCTRLGAGQVEAGRLLVYLGTAAWVAVVEGTDEVSGVRASDAGATTATGAALRWVRSLFSSQADPLSYAALDELAAGAPIGSAGITFLPHLMGERGPEFSPSARGAWQGLTLAHGRNHLVRAVMEGAVFQLRRVLEAGVPPSTRDHASARVLGGICRSVFWTQMLADATGLTVEIPREPEAAARGAALLGARAAGLVTPDVGWPNPVVRVVEPDRTARADYEEAFQRFLACERHVGG
ncbi:MAG: xylulokinase [Acidimicrobiales bacterium]